VYRWSKVIETVAGGADAFICRDGAFHSVYNVNARNISAPTYQTVFRKISRFFEQYPDGQESVVEIVVFPNQAAFAIPDSATAYPWRDTKALLYVHAFLVPQISHLQNKLRKEITQRYPIPMDKYK
jgi:hypothetical protein